MNDIAPAVIGSCAIDPVEQSDECSGLACTILAVDASGSYEFNADKTASFEWHGSVTTQCTVPKACIMVDCQALATETRTCSDEGDHCACQQIDAAEGARSGTWATDEFMLEIEDADGMTGTSNWCVADDRLAINVLASRPLQFDAVGFVGLAKVRLTAERR